MEGHLTFIRTAFYEQHIHTLFFSDLPKSVPALTLKVGVIFAKQLYGCCDLKKSSSKTGASSPSSHVNMSSKSLHLPTFRGQCYVF